jgi:hypothetical protein
VDGIYDCSVNMVPMTLNHNIFNASSTSKHSVRMSTEFCNQTSQDTSFTWALFLEATLAKHVVFLLGHGRHPVWSIRWAHSSTCVLATWVAVVIWPVFAITETNNNDVTEIKKNVQFSSTYLNSLNAWINLQSLNVPSMQNTWQISTTVTNSDF